MSCSSALIRSLRNRPAWAVSAGLCWRESITSGILKLSLSDAILSLQLRTACAMKASPRMDRRRSKYACGGEHHCALLAIVNLISATKCTTPPAPGSV